MERDEDDVSNLRETINIFENPFLFEITDRIIHLSSGVEATDEIQNSYLNAKEEGNKASRLEGKNCLFDTLPLPKHRTFATMNKPKSLKSIVPSTIREDKELYMRLVLVAQVKKNVFEHLLSYPL